MSKFSKGAKVAVLSDWDRKGTVSIRRATVEAWGAKIARFRDEEGNMFKCAISTTRAFDHNFTVMADLPNNVLEAHALAHGAKIVEDEKARFASCLAKNAGENYDNAIRKDIAELHEPRFRWR